jgi:hypothetical protein
MPLELENISQACKCESDRLGCNGSHSSMGILNGL